MAIDYTGFKFAKAPKGSAVLERKASRAQVKKDELGVKAEVTRRDGQKVCRLDPNCPHIKVGIRAEGVHLDDKGMGGDHGVRTTRDRMLRGCFIHHQGAKSIHSGHIRVKYLTDKGTDGPIALERSEDEIDAKTRITRKVWTEFARERAVGVWMTAKELQR